jgi:hypothetical protein
VGLHVLVLVEVCPHGGNAVGEGGEGVPGLCEVGGVVVIVLTPAEQMRAEQMRAV